MALYNEIQVGRINRFVQKLLAIKGGPPTPTVSSDIQFGLSLLNGAETRYLEGWDRYGFSTSITTAASVGAVQLRNPTGSNVVSVIESLYITSTITGNFTLNVGAKTTDYGTAFNPPNFDARGRPSSTCTGSSATTGATSFGGAMRTYNFQAANGSFQDINGSEDMEFALLPGWACQLITPNTTGTYVVSLWFRERYLEDSERS